MSKFIERVIQEKQLPSEWDKNLDFDLFDSGTIYTSMEGELWDFKDKWIEDYADNYCGGIVKLISSFANTAGGVIIFGVNDKTRTSGHNKINPNIDKLKSVLKEYLSEPIKIDFKRYNLNEHSHVDVLLVIPLDEYQLPVKFLKDFKEKKHKNAIYVRQDYEVVRARAEHLVMLYARASFLNIYDQNYQQSNQGGLPSNPATIKNFVARLEAFDEIFRWIKSSDEIRKFLFGKGGSGKSTIAFEVAKTIQDYKKSILAEGNTKFDNVIFITAKQSKLVVGRMPETIENSNDFINEKELYICLLNFSKNYDVVFEELSLDELKVHIKDFFKNYASFIVIDDIDTLSTKGLETGMDFLLQAISRSGKLSKILYTLRNLPSHSVTNSIEVKGLDKEHEYPNFVKECCKQMKVELPNDKILNGQLDQATERRPLVIESVISLRKFCSTYEEALDLLKSKHGENIRQYVFKKEWNALDNELCKHLLTIIALYPKPLDFVWLLKISKFDKDILAETIAAVKDMFLDLVNEKEVTKYTVSDLTREFIKYEAKNLASYVKLDTMVNNFLKFSIRDNEELTNILLKIQNVTASNSYKIASKSDKLTAWIVVNDSKISDKTKHDNRFISHKAFVASLQDNPDVAFIADSYTSTFSSNLTLPTHFVSEWLNLAKEIKNYEYFMTIINYVMKNREYPEFYKRVFLKEKSTFLYFLAINNVQDRPDQAKKYLQESLKSQLEIYNTSNDVELFHSVRYLQSLMRLMFNFYNNPIDLFSNLGTVFENVNYCYDPLFKEIRNYFKFSFQNQNLSKSNINILINKIDTLRSFINNNKKWKNPNDRDELLREIGFINQDLKDKLK